MKVRESIDVVDLFIGATRYSFFGRVSVLPIGDSNMCHYLCRLSQTTQLWYHCSVFYTSIHVIMYLREREREMDKHGVG